MTFAWNIYINWHKQRVLAGRWLIWRFTL